MLPVKISRLVSCARQQAGQTNSTPQCRAGAGRGGAHPALLRARHDPLALRVGVGDAAHGRLGVVLREPQRDGAPAAAHVQQPEAALELVELRPLGVEPQHAVLRLVQQRRRLRWRRAGGGVESGGVLGVLAQHDLVEARRHLVVLLVRVVGVHGDGRGLELLHKGQQPRLLRGVVGLPLLLQPALQQLPDPDARQEVRQLVALERVEEQRREGIREGGARRGDDQRHRAALQRGGGERRNHHQLLERHPEWLCGLRFRRRRKRRSFRSAASWFSALQLRRSAAGFPSQRTSSAALTLPKCPRYGSLLGHRRFRRFPASHKPHSRCRRVVKHKRKPSPTRGA